MSPLVSASCPDESQLATMPCPDPLSVPRTNNQQELLPTPLPLSPRPTLCITESESTSSVKISPVQQVHDQLPQVPTCIWPASPNDKKQMHTSLTMPLFPPPPPVQLPSPVCSRGNNSSQKNPFAKPSHSRCPSNYEFTP